MKCFRSFLFAALLLSICRPCLAQSYYEKKDSALNSCIAKLKEKGIDTICIYRQYCVGCIMTLRPGADTSCRRQPYEYNTYFLWKKNGTTWFTLKNYCFAYDTISINARPLWTFCNSVKAKISSKEIKPVKVSVIENGKRTTNYVMIDHDTHEDIILVIGRVRKDLSLTEFEFEKTVDSNRNLNYTYNWNTDLKKLEVLLDESVHINIGKLKKIK